MPAPLFLLHADRIERIGAKPSWTVLDKHGVEVGRYELAEAYAAADSLNGPLGFQEHQPYTVSFAGDDRRRGNDRRVA